MKVDIKVQGMEQLLDALTSDKKRVAFQKTVMKYSADVHRKATQKAPVDTGFLKRNIRPPAFSDGGMTATVIAAADYSIYQELGTRFMAAQPFMEPAFNEVQQDFLDAIKRVVNS